MDGPHTDPPRLTRKDLMTATPPSSLLYRTLYSRLVARVVPFTEARGRLSELLDDVQRRHEHVVITRNGRPSAVVLAAEEYEAVMESLAVLEDEDTMAALAESEQDVSAGRLQTLDEVKRDLGLG